MKRMVTKKVLLFVMIFCVAQVMRASEQSPLPRALTTLGDAVTPEAELHEELFPDLSVVAREGVVDMIVDVIGKPWWLRFFITLPEEHSVVEPVQQLVAVVARDVVSTVGQAEQAMAQAAGSVAQGPLDVLAAAAGGTSLLPLPLVEGGRQVPHLEVPVSQGSPLLGGAKNKKRHSSRRLTADHMDEDLKNVERRRALVTEAATTLHAALAELFQQKGLKKLFGSQRSDKETIFHAALALGCALVRVSDDRKAQEFAALSSVFANNSGAMTKEKQQLQQDVTELVQKPLGWHALFAGSADLSVEHMALLPLCPVPFSIQPLSSAGAKTE